MNRITFILIRMLLLSQIFVVVDARSFNNQANENNKRFIRINIPIISSTDSCNYYPINTGDFWEYIEKDTTTLLGQFYFGLNFSVIREVLKDTLFDNGKIYKQIKWENVANSVNYEPRYEYHRIDSTGKVYLNYSNQDYLLFDFTLPIGQTYSAHIPNHYWQLSDKYYVIGFGDTLRAIDFKLFGVGNFLKESYTLVENFGITYYQKDMVGYGLPEGSFWGAVLNGVEYGTLIVKKQNIDWKEFYPLHVGNYWVYEGETGSVPIIASVRIISDTILGDGNLYFKSFHIDHTFGYTFISYERVDSIGRIFYWEYWHNNFVHAKTFSINVGDTNKSNFPSTFWRLNNKNGSTLEYFLYPDLAYMSEIYQKGVGLIYETTEQNYKYLKGALINGILLGDTTLTTVNEENIICSQEHVVFNNFPNPFNSTTTLSFYIPISCIVEINVYNSIGEKIKTLLRQSLPPGYHNKIFDASSLTSGLYIYTINAVSLEGNGKTFAKSSKLMLMK